MLRPDSSFLPFSSDCAASSQLLSVKAFLYVSVCLRLQAHLLQCSLYGYGEIEKNIEGGNDGISNRHFGGRYSRYRDNEINLTEHT
jgi:hypothetical protein